MTHAQAQILESLGVDISDKKIMELNKDWLCYSLNHGKPTNDVPIILIERGPKNITEIKRQTKNVDTCIILFLEKNILFLKAAQESQTMVLGSNAEYERITSILMSCNIIDATSELELTIGITKAISAIPNATGDFDNRGIFSTYYLRNRIFSEIRRNTDSEILNLKQVIKMPLDKILEALGWDNINKKDTYYNNKVSIVVANQDDFSIRENDEDVAPSYLAISKLQKCQWVILTNGKKWRLYTNKISASSTNYFEIRLDDQNSILQYFTAIFNAKSFIEKDGKTDIDIFFEEGKNYATTLEYDLSSRIMNEKGLFLDIVKGVINHNLEKTFTVEELESAKQTSLKIMYRIWFLAYAESRNLLPIRDKKYKQISLQFLRNRLDSYDNNPEKYDCWKALLKLFSGIRNGSREHNLPQYAGELFKEISDIDKINIKNHFIVSALHGLLETDGEAVDYANLGVRHLGNILENLMEISVKQAKKNIMLVEKGKKILEVTTKQKSLYSCEKNELYLALKGGAITRKTTASYYTPDKIVDFLVSRGLKPILDEREKYIKSDIKKYKKTKNKKDLENCMNRVLDIQVLDPTMGSGHFLVKVLNKLSVWATDVLKQYPDHPLLKDIESDRETIITEQLNQGIKINEDLLTPEVLLKRKIMKRCIFGVDLNPLAVDLTKLSLWLDSFAIGTPLTYLDHHIKTGDSTIGTSLKELKDPNNHRLDYWMSDSEKPSKSIEAITLNTDITMAQLQKSKSNHEDYLKQIKPYKIMLDTLTALKINDKIIPKKDQRNLSAYLGILADIVSGKIKNPDIKLKQIIEKITEQANLYRFFHWDLEMMDAFVNNRKGFDLIVGNPPWDKIRPNKREFFCNIDEEYKNKTDAEKKKIQKKYEIEFKNYKKAFDEKRTFYKNYGSIGENTDYDLYRIIIERMFDVLTSYGMFSMIMPSAIINSRGATALRKHIITKEIFQLYVFENKNKIFSIHSGYKFALLTIQNKNGQDIFPARFYLKDLKELDDLKDKLLYVSKEKIFKRSPKMLIIQEVRNKKDDDIIQKIFSTHPRLENIQSWSVDLGRELNIGEEKDKKLLVKENGWPVLEAKNFHQYIHNYAKPQYFADIEKTLTRVKTIKKFYNYSKEIHQNPRLVYRGVSSATNTRTMIASIIPKAVFTTMATFMAIPRIGTFYINQDYHNLNSYLCGIFNSTTYDYILRMKIDKNVETYHLYDTPVPENFTCDIAKKISKLSAILTLSNTWNQDLADAFSINKKELINNTLGNRIETVAEIDALVAIHYGVDRDEYEHILTSFKRSNKSFLKEDLLHIIEYQKLPKYERDEHMRIFYGEIYKLVLKYYDTILKNFKIIKEVKND